MLWVESSSFIKAFENHFGWSSLNSSQVIERNIKMWSHVITSVSFNQSDACGQFQVNTAHHCFLSKSGNFYSISLVSLHIRIDISVHTTSSWRLSLPNLWLNIDSTIVLFRFCKQCFPFLYWTRSDIWTWAMYVN